MNHFIRANVALALAVGGVTLHSSVASADGTIYALLTLTNDTNYCIFVPQGTQPGGGVWGTPGNTLTDYGEYEVKPDGSPPAYLAPGETMLWGSKSNGGLSPSGTGGTLTIPMPETETATIQWSVPWSYFNGLGGSANTTGSGVTHTGTAPADPFVLTQAMAGCSGNGSNTCLFSMVMTGGGPPSGNVMAGQLGSDQCFAPKTACPPGVVCNSQMASVVSTDGSTTFEINPSDAAFGTAPTAWGGPLELRGPNGVWSNYVYDVATVQLLPSGNLVGYDAGGNVVWQTNTTAANPFLSVTPNLVSLMAQGVSCMPRLGCVPVTQTVWSAADYYIRIF